MLKKQIKKEAKDELNNSNFNNLFFYTNDNNDIIIIFETDIYRFYFNGVRLMFKNKKLKSLFDYIKPNRQLREYMRFAELAIENNEDPNTTFNKMKNIGDL